MTPARVQLESSLPSALAVGTATAVLLRGWCSSGQKIEGMAIFVDGVRHRARGVHTGYFFATVPIPARDRPGTIEIEARVVLAGGAEHRLTLGRIEVVQVALPPPYDAGNDPGLIAVCMATYEPDMSLFEAQIESLRAQRDNRWICLISDDCSGSERFAQMAALIAGDRRFFVSRSTQRRGFYRNFERALEMVPPTLELVALCDQDDHWHEDKLGVLRGALGKAQLVYSDQRLVATDGAVLWETLWTGRRNNHTNLASLLVANTITGAATLMRRELLKLALPFPDTPGYQLHDHWLGLVALAAGDIAYVDRPLYDYVQHSGAVFGDAFHGGRAKSWRPEHSILERWRASYFYGYLAREVQAQTLLVRLGATMDARKRRALEWFVASGRSPLALGWLVSRSLRALVGLNETLGSELELAQGIVWRWLSVIRAKLAKRGIGGSPPVGLPPLAAFDQRRLRRWRSSGQDRA